MQSYEKRMEHAQSLGIDENCVGWTIILMNRGPKAINNSLIGYHWVVGIISPEGQVFYGDPLNSVEVPQNFGDMLNPYYKARFGTDIPDVFNCSNEEMFPNFPKQLSDAHICGFVGLLVMLLAKEPRYLQFILSGHKLDSSGLDFISFPGKYSIYLKQIFQILFVDKIIPMKLLVTKAEIKRMVKQSSLWAKLPFSRSKQYTRRIPGMPLADHLNATRGGHAKLKRTKKIVKRIPQQPELDIPKQPGRDIPQQPGKDIPQQPEQDNPQQPELGIPQQPELDIPQQPGKDIPQQPELEIPQQPGFEIPQQPGLEIPQQPELDGSLMPELQDSQQPDLQVSQEPDRRVSQQPKLQAFQHPDLQVEPQSDTEALYNGNFLGEIIWDGKTSIINNDGYNWKAKGKKKSAKYWQEYICTEECQGTKFAKKQNHCNFGGMYGAVWKVNYTIEHTCEWKGLKKVGPKKNVANSSYILCRIANSGQTDKNDRHKNRQNQTGHTPVVRKNKNKIHETRRTTIEPTIEIPANDFEKARENVEVSIRDNGDIESFMVPQLTELRDFVAHGGVNITQDRFSENSDVFQSDFDTQENRHAGISDEEISEQETRTTTTTTIKPILEVPAPELEKASEDAGVSNTDNENIESHGLAFDMSQDMFSQNSILDHDDGKKAKVPKTDSHLVKSRFIDEEDLEAHGAVNIAQDRFSDVYQGDFDTNKCQHARITEENDKEIPEHSDIEISLEMENREVSNCEKQEDCALANVVAVLSLVYICFRLSAPMLRAN